MPAHSYGEYSINLPVADVTGGLAMIALRYATKVNRWSPITVGPRFLAPHPYFRKSAKRLNALQFTKRNEPRFWEQRGYSVYGDL